MTTTKLGKITIPESVAKRIPTQISDRIADIKFPDIKFPEVKLPEVTIPDEVRRPINATREAAEVAVERVRGAVVTAQGRVVKTQQSLTEKASTVVGDTAATASTAYADITKRGAAVIHRVWPDSADTTSATEIKDAPKPAVKKPAVKKPAVKKPAAKKPTARKPAAKKPVATSAAVKSPAAKKPVAAAAPKAAAPKAATPKTVETPSVAVVAEVTKES
jgi:hypothetical protein